MMGNDRDSTTLKEMKMKKMIVSLVLGLAAASAFASCPWPTKYQCYQQSNGKMRCGCY
jgi:hypothetical protein